ncbi:MAG TPA: ATP-binding protein [Casimicrobiaceae bacterium]|nr:ATP-binding protein [Casimicrobiaceae bacterium]
MSSLLSSRSMRWVLLASASLAAIALFLLATASANTGLFAQSYDNLLVLNGVLVTVLIGIVLWQLWRLRRGLKRGVFGSRLAVRLVLLFAMVAVLPGVLVYAVSVNFMARSIESWFDVRVDRALEGGLNVGRVALDSLLKDASDKARRIGEAIAESTMPAAVALSRAAEQTGANEAALYSTSGAVLAIAGVGSSAAAPEPPTAQALRRARLQQPTAEVAQRGDTLLLRVVVPVNSSDRLEPLRLLQVIEPVPRGLAEEVEKVQAGWRDYQEIVFSRDALKRLYGLTLTLTLLLALGSSLGLAVVLSERFSEPLGLLAEGTRAVAEGDFTRRQPVVSKDELGVLTQSFNAMTAQLAEAHARNEDSRRAIETTRAYLESILGNLSAGVLAFDENYRLRSANKSAAVILQQPLADLVGMPLADWGRRQPSLAPFAELVASAFRSSRDGPWQKEAALSVGNLTRSLLMRGTRLPGAPVPGYVVVFDDVSELLQAQRDAAWAEVARRLAHEIKNPLTPIQLSAERLAVKLDGKVEGSDAEALKRGTSTIVTQVQAMKQMVDDFAIYARTPRPGQMQPVDLSALLLDVLALYDNLRPQTSVTLPEAPAVIHGEPTRLRQVLHNLLQNAVDAQVGQADPRYEVVLQRVGNDVSLSVADAGAGFAGEVIDRAFEPYVTTKSKGTGLGLAIVKKIVDEHGGRVAVENLEQGARVTISFPAVAR